MISLIGLSTTSDILSGKVYSIKQSSTLSYSENAINESTTARQRRRINQVNQYSAKSPPLFTLKIQRKSHRFCAILVEKKLPRHLSYSGKLPDGARRSKSAEELRSKVGEFVDGVSTRQQLSTNLPPPDPHQTPSNCYQNLPDPSLVHSAQFPPRKLMSTVKMGPLSKVGHWVHSDPGSKTRVSSRLLKENKEELTVHHVMHWYLLKQSVLC